MNIFLSAVTVQFKAARDALASDLRAVGARVVVQEDFQQHGRTLLEKLEQAIAACDRVIVLLGDAYGWEPPAGALPAGTPRRSYTQWEYCFAAGERLAGKRQPAKDVFVYFASPALLASLPVEQPADAAALQQAFLATIRASGKDRNGFGSLDELRALVLRDGFRLDGRPSLGRPGQEPVAGQPELVLERFEVTPSTRFFYGARRVPCLGREAELGALQAFLDGADRFRWWLMCGPAGVGKHRLALELCLQNQAAWRAGWLVGPPSGGWSAWQPSAPTLVIVDDMAAQAEAVRHMAVALYRRREGLDYPVRILLLEREPRGTLYERFVGTGGERHAIEAGRLGEPLALGGLAEPEVWEIVRIVLAAEGAGLPDRQKTMAAFQAIDPQRRPLFAAFAADAIAAGRTLEQWDGKELLASVLGSERERRWAPAGVTEKDKNLMALATMTGGLPVAILKDPPIAELLPAPRDYAPERYRVMSGRPAERRLAPLAPSVLGDFFVLDHLAPTSDLDERADLMRTAALKVQHATGAERRSGENARPEDPGPPSRPYLRFLEQAARNFPGHPTLSRLRVPPPDDGAATFQWGIDAANLIEILDEPANASLCREVLADLRQVAFPREGAGLATLRYRTAKAAVTMLVRAAIRGDLEAGAALYRDLQAMAAVDRGLLQQLAAGGATLVRLLARRGKLQDAADVYEELRLALAELGPDEAKPIAALAMAAAALVTEYARAGQLTLAHGRYEELEALADRESIVAKGQPSIPFELPLEQAKAAASLIEACADAGDMPAAYRLYEKLRALVAAHGPRQDSSPPPSPPPPPQPVTSPSAGEALVGALVLGVLDLGLRQLAGQGFSLFPRQEARDVGPALTERQGYAAIVLVRGYGAARAFERAAEVYEELRALASPAQHPELLSHWGRATYCLIVAFLEDGQRTAARAAYDQLIEIASAHGDAAVPIRARAAALHAMVRAHVAAGEEGAAAAIATASADFLRQAGTRPTIEAMFGQRACEEFYRLTDRLTARAATPATDTPP